MFLYSRAAADNFYFRSATAIVFKVTKDLCESEALGQRNMNFDQCIHTQ